MSDIFTRCLEDLCIQSGVTFVGIQDGLYPHIEPQLHFEHKGKKFAINFDAVSFEANRDANWLRARIVKKLKEEEPVPESPAVGTPATQPLSIDAKLHAIYQEIDYIEKGGHNKGQNYRYIKSVDVTREIRAALVRARVYAEIFFDFDNAPYTIAREKAPNAPFSAVNCKCRVVFHDLDSKETRVGEGLGTGADTGDKAAYKAQTGALKYALKNAFLVPDEKSADDPEADERTNNNEEPSFEDAKTAPAPSHGKAPQHQPAQQAAPRPDGPKATGPMAPPPAAATAAAPAPPANPAPAPTPASTTTTAPPEPSRTAPSVSAPSSQPGDAQGATLITDPQTDSDSSMPTNEQMVEYRKQYAGLYNVLTEEGKLKSSKGLPGDRKQLVFMCRCANVADPKEMTNGQWRTFFATVENLRTKYGWPAVTELVNKANGIEPTKK